MKTNKLWYVTFAFALTLISSYWFSNPFLRAKAVEQQSHDLPFDNTGLIRGRVTDETGAALPHVEVYIVDGVTNYSTPQVFADENGFYTTSNLPFGSYKVCVYSVYYVLPECYDDIPLDQQATLVVLSESTPIQENINLSLSLGATISGRVMDGTGTGISSTEVRSFVNFGPGWQVSKSGYTDANGNYTISGMVAGTYRICASPGTSHLGKCYNDVDSIDGAQDIVLADLQRVSSYDLHLPLGGSITGVVTDRDGQPVHDLQIRPYKLEHFSENVAYWIPINKFANVQSDGTYVLPGLSTETYRLEITSPSLEYLPYMSEFYNDASSVETATDIPVQAGQTVPNINFQVGKFGVIGGHVSDVAGLPVENMIVQVEKVAGDQQRHQPEMTIPNLGRTDATGNYTITVEDTGLFRLYFFEDQFSGPVRGYISEYYNNSLNAENATLIPVQPDSITMGINAELSRRGLLAGKIKDENGNPLSQVSVNVYRPSTCCGWELRGGATTQDDGAFQFFNQESGTYRLCFSPLSHEFALVCYLDAPAVDIATDIPVLTDTTALINMQIPRAGIITGTITSAYHTPVSGATVKLFMMRPIESGKFRFDLGTRLTFNDGLYSFAGLTPTNAQFQYFLEVSPITGFPSYLGEFFDNQPTLEQATPMLVNKGETVSADIQLAFDPTVNAPPYVRDDAVWVKSLTGTLSNTVFTSGAITILANDQDFNHDSLAIELFRPPAHGTVELAASGVFTYTPNGSNTLFDSINYRVNDGISDSNVATVSIILPDAKNLFLPLVER